MGQAFRTLEWKGDRVSMIDQRKLPLEETYVEYEDAEGVARAIREMVVRGAPAIGVAAAMGVALGAKRLAGLPAGEAEAAFQEVCRTIRASRPTAVNLFWAVDRMERVARLHMRDGWGDVARALEAEAIAMEAEDIEVNRRMGHHGAELLPDPVRILTHCNAGALATAGYGTALGIVRAAVEMGKRVHVFADETRPFLQGARLTAWELKKDGIPVTLLTDAMAGYLMKQGRVDCVIVGTDRTVANGDVANKIGTYSVAVLAREHRIPFYVAAPTSTIDLDTPDGSRIQIEHRNPSEVTHLFGTRIAPEGVEVFNPAFDVTPAALVTAIVTENGVARPPYEESLARVKRGG